MESVAPTLKACAFMRIAVESGLSMRLAAKQYLEAHHDECSAMLAAVVLALEHGKTEFAESKIASECRRALFDLVHAGFKGEPVAQRLRALESEITLRCEQEIERHIALLPLKTLIPLMLFQMPAFFLMLFGPLLNEFTKGL